MKLFCFILSCIGFASVSSAQNNSLQKESPGVVKIQIDGPAASMTKKPLLLVDNFETDFESMVLSPNNIESITVLKDASATALYGSKGTAGVILIKTKPGTEFYTIADFVNAEKNTNVQAVKLNEVVLTDIKKLLVEKVALKQTTISSNFKLDKNCKAVSQNVLVVMTAPGNLH